MHWGTYSFIWKMCNVLIIDLKQLLQQNSHSTITTNNYRTSKSNQHLKKIIHSELRQQCYSFPEASVEELNFNSILNINREGI